MTVERPLAERLRSLRVLRKLTQPELAARAGISLSLLAKLEQGQTNNPRLDTLRALAKALGVTLDELAGSKE